MSGGYFQGRAAARELGQGSAPDSGNIIHSETLLRLLCVSAIASPNASRRSSRATVGNVLWASRGERLPLVPE